MEYEYLNIVKTKIIINFVNGTSFTSHCCDNSLYGIWEYWWDKQDKNYLELYKKNASDKMLLCIA